MYSDKKNVNILTSLLVTHGVNKAVVCPGSRNAPLVHNFNECPDIECFPVTDERSAGFYALGMALQLSAPVVVCVTSGTALLNLYPAVAEAFYQHVPLIVVSADRPQKWIDQLQGQTLPQPDALGRFVKRAVSLPSVIYDDTTRWHCNRMVNEALLASVEGEFGPVHINVPITEPLYLFDVESLPDERVISMVQPISLPSENNTFTTNIGSDVLCRFQKACRPMIVMGQMKSDALPLAMTDALVQCNYVVLHEPLSAGSPVFADEMITLIPSGKEQDYLPDFILYVGDMLVSKRIRKFLSMASDAECWIINPAGQVRDVFMNLSGVIKAEPRDVLCQISAEAPTGYFGLWNELLCRAMEYNCDYLPPYSEMLAVKLLEQGIGKHDASAKVHYANSLSVRLGCICSGRYIFCNRGVNGIEGSLSTAAGMSVLTDENVYCVIGDLSFFYDANALWNQNLRGNLRILLLNNGCGGIFGKFAALRDSSARERLVMASHHATAQGVCMQNDCRYFSVENEVQLYDGIDVLTQSVSERPVIVEVFTDADVDMQAIQDYFKGLTI